MQRNKVETTHPLQRKNRRTLSPRLSWMSKIYTGPRGLVQKSQWVSFGLASSTSTESCSDTIYLLEHLNTTTVPAECNAARQREKTGIIKAHNVIDCVDVGSRGRIYPGFFSRYALSDGLHASGVGREASSHAPNNHALGNWHSPNTSLHSIEHDRVTASAGQKIAVSDTLRVIDSLRRRPLSVIITKISGPLFALSSRTHATSQRGVVVGRVGERGRHHEGSSIMESRSFSHQQIIGRTIAEAGRPGASHKGNWVQGI